MGWPSKLTYEDLVARGVRRSVNILACYGDLETAAALFESDPAQADDPEALASAAGGGHADFVRLMLRYQPDLPRRITIVAKTPELTELLFKHGMDPSRANWLGITPLHRFAGQGNISSARGGHSPRIEGDSRHLLRGCLMAIWQTCETSTC
jgi:hypothetical protein